MANDQTPDMSSEYVRLASFGGNTIDVAAVMSSSTEFVDLRYNSPMKLAKAGFYCVSGSQGDMLSCFACSAQWKNPQGESPMAVHRALNPNCPFLKGSTPVCTAAPWVIPHSQINNARRCLFPQDSENTGFTAENNNYLYKYQDHQHGQTFSPIGGPDFLFESRRILTFDNLTSSSEHLLKASEWAENGFIFQQSNMVRCVFCGLCLPFLSNLPKSLHEHCPFVCNDDVGNITLEMENTINSMKQTELPSVEMQFAFVLPQYKNIDLRRETFREWSPQMSQTSNMLSESGFYYTGCADKVVCFCCGLGLKKWRGQADPWTQHARLSPQCTFLREKRGNNFVQDAQLAEVQVDFDPPKTFQEGAVTSNGTVTTTSPVSSGLDLNVIKAALECQYTMAQIRQAILNIHNLTCGFPNFPLLIGELLKEQHCQQAMQQNKTLQQEKERERQEKERVIQEKEMERQEKEMERQEKERVIQEKEMERQEKERERQRGQQLEEEKEMERQEKERERQRGQQLEEEKERDQQQMYAEVLRMAQEKQTWQDRFRQEEERRRQEEERRRQEEERRRREEQQHVTVLSRQEEELQRLRAEIIRLSQGQPAPQQDAAAPPPPPITNLAPQCIICNQEPATALFLPCAHLCCGVQCSQHFLMNPCPVCRQHVQQRKIIYVA